MIGSRQESPVLVGNFHMGPWTFKSDEKWQVKKRSFKTKELSRAIFSTRFHFNFWNQKITTVTCKFKKKKSPNFETKNNYFLTGWHLVAWYYGHRDDRRWTTISEWKSIASFVSHSNKWKAGNKRNGKIESTISRLFGSMFRSRRWSAIRSLWSVKGKQISDSHFHLVDLKKCFFLCGM